MTQGKKLSKELLTWLEFIRARALKEGLDFFEVIFEMVDYKEINELAALGGFPTRYPHWRFGMDFDRLSKSYTHGLSKIYEMVINTDPCYAYLLSANGLTEQKLVMAHVYGHSDFFKNNQSFSHTNRRMLDQMANHAVRVRDYQERYGVEVVEEFIDRCLSLDNLLDLNFAGIKRQSTVDTDADPYADPKVIEPTKIKAKSYMDKFVNPVEKLEAERKKLQEEQKKKPRFPESAYRDVLLFLLEHAPLQRWQQDVLGIVREEAYYFAPQGQTKIMNEGWASYWHAKIMTEHLVSDSEVIDFADVHSGTLATPPGGFNPYKIGYELFHDIEDRWNRGRFGSDWDACDDYVAKAHWDKKLGLGRQKIFEVRKLYNDLTFIDEFFTEDFCRRMKFFTFANNERTGQSEIESREFAKIKTQFLRQLTNFGQPIIEVTDGNYMNRGELLLRHVHDGMDLRQDYAELTLQNLKALWNRPVHIATLLEDKRVLWSFDGQEFSKKDQ
jgi:stage V sporulation protein R